MNKFLYLLLVGAFFILSCDDKKEKKKEVRIAAASNLKYVLDELKYTYSINNPDINVQTTYGASGILTQQIIKGAPFDIFMSADTIYSKALVKEGKTVGEDKIYAGGKVAIWSSSLDMSEGIDIIKSPSVNKIAIANPYTAPYGKMAISILKSSDIYESIENKIVWGENISQTAQFAFSGNAEVGFIALSLALAPEMKNKGSYYILPNDIAQSIEQSLVVLKTENEEEAKKFVNFIMSEEAKPIWIKYGYDI